MSLRRPPGPSGRMASRRCCSGRGGAGPQITPQLFTTVQGTAVEGADGLLRGRRRGRGREPLRLMVHSATETATPAVPHRPHRTIAMQHGARRRRQQQQHRLPPLATVHPRAPPRPSCAAARRAGWFIRHVCPEGPGAAGSVRIARPMRICSEPGDAVCTAISAVPAAWPWAWRPAAGLLAWLACSPGASKTPTTPAPPEGDAATPPDQLYTALVRSKEPPCLAIPHKI